MSKPDKKRLKRDRRIAKKLGFKLDKNGHPIAAGYPNPGIYILGDEYSRRYSGEDRYALNGNSVELQSYKGHVLLSVDPKPSEDTQAAARLGLRLGASAWLDGNEFDAVIALLREAKQVWLKEHRLRMAIASCERCPSGGLCDRHRAAIRSLRAYVETLCAPSRKKRKP